MSSVAKVGFPRIENDVVRVTSWGVAQNFIAGDRLALVGASIGGSAVLLAAPALPGVRVVATLGAAGALAFGPDGPDRIRTAIERAAGLRFFLASSQEDPFEGAASVASLDPRTGAHPRPHRAGQPGTRWRSTSPFATTCSATCATRWARSAGPGHGRRRARGPCGRLRGHAPLARGPSARAPGPGRDSRGARGRRETDRHRRRLLSRRCRHRPQRAAGRRGPARLERRSRGGARGHQGRAHPAGRPMGAGRPP